MEATEMSRKVNCFIAYPSQPPSLVETIELAIMQINQSGLVSLKSWKSTSVAGKFVITTICESIGASDIFVCDLTYLNLSLIHISEPTRLGMISYAVFCLKKKKPP